MIRIDCSEKYCDNCCFKELTRSGLKLTNGNAHKIAPYNIFYCDLYKHALYHELKGKTYRLGCCVLAEIENKPPIGNL
jgi:hypothetical protein